MKLLIYFPKWCAVLFLSILVIGSSACKPTSDINEIVNPNNIDSPSGTANGVNASGNDTPGITAISPSSGTPAGGTIITITGSGFDAGATVLIGGDACSSVLVASTQINCVTPAHAAGNADVVVTNPNSNTTTMTGGFYYVPPPTITSVNPNSGSTTGGTVITIDGTGFVSGSLVFFDSASCPVASTSATEITCTIPAHPAGTVDVSIQNPDGQSALLANGFTYATGPYVATISPTGGTPTGGTTVTITGTGFVSTTTVTIGSANCTPVVILSPTSMTCTTGSSTVGTDNVVVANGTETSTLTNGYTYESPPLVTSISPTGGASGGGTAITIAGSGFLNGASVSLGNAPCTGVNVVSAAQITCTSSSHSSGQVNVIVTNPDNQVGTITNGFTYQPGPYVSGISPSSGSPSGGTNVTVSGTGFLSGATVSIGGSSCISPTVTATSITCQTTAHAAGAATVLVTNTDTQSASLTNAFVYQSGPQITAVSPQAGALAGGTTLTITGSQFVSGLTVTIGGSTCTSPLVNATQISCTTPAHAQGSQSLTVTNPDTQSNTLSGAFTYEPAPTFTSIAPSAGSPSGGNSVTIVGTNFISGVSVTIGANPCTSILNSTTQISCNVPSHAPGSANVVITNPDTQSVTASGAYNYNATPTVSSIAPTGGNPTGGNSVTITGTNFNGSTVTIGGVTCSSPTVNPTTITCQVGAHAAGVTSVIVTNSDSQTATLANGYTYEPAPTVSGVNPSAGPLTGGQSVTINGTNFISGATVSLGGVACNGVAFVSSNQLTCTTGSNSAGTVGILVTNSDTQTGSAASVYTYQGPPSFTSINPVGGALAGGTSVTITGSGFNSNATVTLGGSSCSPVIFNSSTSLSCTTSSHAAGMVNAIITNPDNQSITASNAFTYEAAPTLTSISPNAGALAGGTTVTLTGTGYLSGAQVTIGGAACSTLSQNSTNITCNTSLHSSGSFNVVVTNSDQQTAVLSYGYTYEAAPFISGITPGAGSINGNTFVTISGSGFINGALTAIGGVTCTSPSISSTQITCLTGANTAGTDNIVVTNPDTQTYTLNASYIYRPAPTVTSLSPSSGPVTGSTPVTITGTGFLASPVVTVGGSTCTTPNTVNSTTITCTTPAHVSGAVAVQVTNSDGQTGSLASGFTYIAGPTVSTIAPAAGALAGGTSVTITGSNLSASDTVTVGGVNCGSVTSTSSSSLSCVTGMHSAATVSAVVTDTYTQSATLSNSYSYEAAPTFTSVALTAGPLAGNSSITITGTNFISGLSVLIGSGACTNISNSSTNITCTTPAGSPGPANITITNPDTQTVTSNGAYTYEAAPSVSAVSPAAGSINGGTTLTISGTGFLANAAVSVGGSACSLVSLSSTSITCNTSSHGAATVAVQVTNTDTQAGSLSSAYTYQPAPTVAGASPNIGFVGGGYTITITGTGFLGTPTVTFGGTPCTNVSLTNSTTLTCTNPAKTAGAVTLSVTNSDNQVGSLGSAFTYATNSFYRMEQYAGNPSPIGAFDATGSAARLNQPTWGVVVSGIFYFTENGNCAVRALNLTNQTSSVLAGSETQCAYTDNATATSVRFSSPQGIATDGTYLYVADTTNNAIRQVTISSGATVTLAGGNGAGSNDSPTPKFNSPESLTVTAGYVYIADTGNYTIRQVQISNGNTVTIAGTAGTAAWANGNGAAANFNSPNGITTDGTNLYVSDYSNYVIRQIVIGAPWTVTTPLGQHGTAGGADGVGNAATLWGPVGITYDGAGNLYYADWRAHTIRKVVISTWTVSTIAGTYNYSGDVDGTGTVAKFYNPRGLAINGNMLYVADYSNHAIRQMNLTNLAVTTFLDESNVYGYNDGTLSTAKFNNVRGLAIFNGNLYLGDTGNDLIRQISLSAQTVSTIAGTYTSCAWADGYGTDDTRVCNTYGMTTDGINIYFVDYSNHVVRQYNPTSQQLITVAGQEGVAGPANGTGNSAQFSNPYGITTDGTNLYVADYSNSSIRQVVIGTWVVTTLAGVNGTTGSSDGIGSAALFRNPTGITTDKTYLYVTDYNNHTIRKVQISNGNTITLAGSPGVSGYADNTGNLARFYNPIAITYDGTYLYVADYNNQAVRQVTTGTGMTANTGVVTTILGSPTKYNDSGSSVLASASIRTPSNIWWDSTGLYVSNAYGIKQLH